ncbi:MAG: D-aminoacyl-tRNA deacylase, partial [Dehalococcoidia bacterium]
MQALVQRVTNASVTVSNKTVGEIGQGLVVLLGVARDDSPEDARYLAD